MKNALHLSTWLIAVSACLPGQVHAQNTALSRAEVKAEFLRARAAGELPSSADLFGPALQQAMKKPRTEQAGQAQINLVKTDRRPVDSLPQSAASTAQR